MVGDRYRILEVLKSRAQTATYLAIDSRAGGSRVVLRELPVPDLGPRNDLQVLFAWFEEERKLLGRVQHPSMARLRDFHFLDGWLYLVTEYVEGQTLEAELTQTIQQTGQPLPAEELVYQILDVLELLDNLHALDPPMLHRDIKPANLVREAGTGSIRLVGIGLARPGETATAQAAGGYSPLEQIHGKAEPRSDLYALGATLSQLLTGEPPIPLGILPVLDLNPKVDPELAALVDRACAFTPEKRFQSAREMGEALNDWLERRGTFLPTNLSSAELVAPEPAPEPEPEDSSPWVGLPPLGPVSEPVAASPGPAPAAPPRPALEAPRRFAPAPPAQWKPRPRPPVFPKRTEAMRHQVVPPRPTAAPRTVVSSGGWQALEHQATRDPARAAAETTYEGEYAWLAEPPAAPPQSAPAPAPPPVEEDDEEELWSGGVPQTEDESVSRASVARPESQAPREAASPGARGGQVLPSSGPPASSQPHASSQPPAGRTPASNRPPAGSQPPASSRPPASSQASSSSQRPAGSPPPAQGRPPADRPTPRPTERAEKLPERNAPVTSPPAPAPSTEPTSRHVILKWVLFLVALGSIVLGGYFAGRHFGAGHGQPPQVEQGE